VERNKLTLRGLPISLGYGAEVSRVIVSRKRAAPRRKGQRRRSHRRMKDAMLEWRISYTLLLMLQQKPKHVRELLI